MEDINKLFKNHVIDFWDKYCEEYPEKILEFSDWMNLDIKPYKISLDRFKKLLLEKALNT